MGKKSANEFEVVHHPPPPLQRQEHAPTNDEREDSPSPSKTDEDPPSPSKTDEDPPLPSETDRGTDSLTSSPASKSSSTNVSSSGNGSTDEATQTLLSFQRAVMRKRKFTSSLNAPQKSIKKKKSGAAKIRPTASFAAYCKFMKVLEPKMWQCHWDAYQGCTFQHYVKFGPPALDRPTLELVLRHYKGNEVAFSLPDAESGREKVVNFDMDWVHEHTGFPIDGEIIYNNRDPFPRLWVEYFDEHFTRTKKKSTKNMRRYVEELLQSLVESRKKKDIEDFVLLQILYQCSMMWCPSSVQGIPRLLFKYVDSIERVRNVAWGKYIYDQTKKGIKIAREGLHRSGVSYVPGCMPLIPLWYYEMTGIKRYSLSNRFKPPLTNWVKVGEKYGSFRKRTIVAKAAKASIQVVHKPIVEIGPSDEKYPIRRPLMRLRREGIVPQFPVVHREEKKAAVRKRKIEEKKKEEEKEHEKRWSIGLIMSKAIDEAFEREDEIETLPVEEQLQFWRNAAKVNQRLCRTLRVSKKLYCQTFMDEIRRLNEKVKGLDESCDIVDPLILKNNVKKLIAQQLKGNPTVEEEEEDKHEIDGEYNYGERDDVTMNEGVDEMSKNEERDEVIKNEEDKQMVEDEEGSNGERDDVTMNEGVEEMGKNEERDEVIKDEEDKQMVEDEEGSREERDDVTKNEVVEEMGKSEERDEVIKDEEDKQLVQEEEGVVENVPLSKGLKRPRKPVSKKYVGYRSRAPSKRATKKGKLVRTPFTEDKKPRAKELKLKEGEHKDEPIVVGDTPKKITVYHDDSVGKWDVLKSTYLTDVDRAALKEVNEGIPDVGTFSLRVLDSAGAFVHNYRIPKNVAEKLSAEENKWLAQFCKEKCSP